MATQRRSISGSVVAITGAARGIGRATAQALIQRGARVAIGDLDLELARESAAALGDAAAAYELDVTDRRSFQRFLESVEGDLGPVDVLVNNAGIMPLGSFIEEEDTTAARMIDINLHGVMLGMKLALPGMLKRGRGHVVNIASGAGKSGFAGGATYCATKHAVVGLSESVLAELRGSGVELSIIMPGVVKTELASGLSEARGIKNLEPEDVAAAIAETLEQPRFEVFVPRSVGPITKALSLLPRGARQRVAQLLGADQILATVDAGRRGAYERRISASSGDPAAGGGDPPAGGEEHTGEDWIPAGTGGARETQP